MARGKTIGNRIAPARFLAFLAIMAAGWLAFVPLVGLERGLLIGFDLGALIFLIASAPLLYRGASELRDTAAKNDANRWMLLAITFVLTLVVFAAIAAQLGGDLPLNLLHKLLIVATLILVWTFGNAVFAFHYAHLYYSRGRNGKDCGGLNFPGGAEPGMADFIYFAFTLGVAVQTADVAITSPHIRRVVTFHCIAGFFFNLGVLALAVNVLAG